MTVGGSGLARRLERYRSATALLSLPRRSIPARTAGELAVTLASAIDGEVIQTADGVIVRREAASRPIAIDRDRLASLPGQPPPDVPLICLDTETTGLATAAGTVAFLIGLGWWQQDQFHQVQLLLPDHADERALLSALAAAIPHEAWLVTYNGRGFDWPLLVARYRLARRSAPAHAGHLDLLPIVRRLFRHRMTDARLRTAEAHLLGLRRIGDVEGWEIPARYLQFLRSGSAADLVEVVRHNDQDVRSLAWLLVHLEAQFGDPTRRAKANPGDLAGLARSFARERRLPEALACLDFAMDRAVVPAASNDQDPWWSPRQRPDFGGLPRRRLERPRSSPAAALDIPWTSERVSIDRAHLLRRLGRFVEAAEAWESLAAGTGRTAIVASIELAKLQEHRLRNRSAARRAVARGLSVVERRHRLGYPEPGFQIDLVRRLNRLQRHALSSVTPLDRATAGP